MTIFDFPELTGRPEVHSIIYFYVGDKLTRGIVIKNDDPTFIVASGPGNITHHVNSWFTTRNEANDNSARYQNKNI